MTSESERLVCHNIQNRRLIIVVNLKSHFGKINKE